MNSDINTKYAICTCTCEHINLIYQAADFQLEKCKGVRVYVLHAQFMYSIKSSRIKFIILVVLWYSINRDFNRD